jgi:uncharacterized membrane protein
MDNNPQPNSNEAKATEPKDYIHEEEGVPAEIKVPTPPPTTDNLDFSSKAIITAASYVGPLVIIPYMLDKENPFTLFHIKQGLVVFVIGLIGWVLTNFLFMGWLYPLITLLNLGLFVLSIMGIINVLKRKEAELPLVGQFAKHIKI